MLTEDITRTLFSIGEHLRRRQESSFRNLFSTETPDRLDKSIREICQQSLTEAAADRLIAVFHMPALVVVCEGEESAENVSELQRHFDHLRSALESWNQDCGEAFAVRLEEALRLISLRLLSYTKSIEAVGDICVLRPELHQHD